ncbi:hypothetical protein DOY81_011978 [Sarcophaga bullata]|nr:hypothetical protein DOY81_011978 [Sarcophaga bullata]
MESRYQESEDPTSASDGQLGAHSSRDGNNACRSRGGAHYTRPLDLLHRCLWTPMTEKR